MQIAHWSLKRASVRIAAQKREREAADKEVESQEAEDLRESI